MKKKFIAINLLITMLLTLFPIQAFAVNDLPNDDYSAALTKSVDNGLLVGYDNSLHPDKIITRAEMVTVVNRAFGASEQADISKFGDVGENDWFYNDMRKSVAMGVLVGDGKGLNPLKDITREEAFVILSRALGVRTDGLEKEFKDLDKVSNWAKKSIDGMISAGYIKESNGYINPKQTITRAEFAQIMDNIFKEYIRSSTVYTGIKEGNVIVNVPNASLKDMVIKGDLIIGDGVGAEDLNFENVKVEGKIIVRSGNGSGILIKGASDIRRLINLKEKNIIKISSEKEMHSLSIDGYSDVVLEGEFDNLEVNASDITVFAEETTIKRIVINGQRINLITKEEASIKEVIAKGEAANVEGAGKVEEVKVEEGGDNTTVTTPNTEINVDEKVDNVRGTGAVEIKSAKTYVNGRTSKEEARPKVVKKKYTSSSPAAPVAIKYTITFNSNGGSDVDAIEVKENDKITLPVEPTKDEYVFEGWYRDDEIFAIEFIEDTRITKSLTLYAKWESKYVLATDDDFSGEADSEFKYIGTDKYVEIPHVIKGIPVTSYYRMFEEKSPVKGVKSDNLNIIDMREMFYGNKSEILDLSSLDTSNVSRMESMFFRSQAKTLDLSNFDTSNVKYMNQMLFGTQATTIDLSSFDTSSVINMNEMFAQSEAITLDVSNFDTSNVTDMSQMFKYSKATELNLSNFDTSNVTDMSSMFEQSKATSIDLSNFDTSSVTNMSSMFAQVEVIFLDVSNFDTSNVTSMNYMFMGSKSISINLSNFDTSKVEHMAKMFYSNQASSLDLSSFNTSQVTNMHSMFYGSQANTLDLRSFDTANVTYITDMFKNCAATEGYARTQADADNFNASSSKPEGLTFEVKSKYALATDDDFEFIVNNIYDSYVYDGKKGYFRYKGTEEYVEIPHIIKGVAITSYYKMFEGTFTKGVKSTNENITNMYGMFYASQASSLDLSNLDTSNVTNMAQMFKNSGVISLDLSSFDTLKVKNMSNMFEESQVILLDLSNIDVTSVQYVGDMFKDCAATKGYTGSQVEANKLNSSSGKPENLIFKVKIRYVLATDSDFSGDADGEFRYVGTDKYVEIPHVIKDTQVTSYYKMFEATSVEGVKSDNKNVIDMRHMFNSNSAPSINLSKLDSSSVTNMSGMFWWSQANSLDLSNFDTSETIDMSEMFIGSFAKLLDLSNFNTSNVMKMSSMFKSCRATSLDLSSFDTSKVTDMSKMFMGSWATSLDLSKFDTSNVIDMSEMFNGNNATLLDLSTFNTSYVTDMSNMFNGSRATSLDISNFDTSNVINMSYMFKSSYATSLDLSNFDTSKVTDMSAMFADSKATSLDLSSFATTNVTNMKWMFQYTQLTTLDLSSFDVSNVTEMKNMFYDSPATTGYARTQADADNFNASSSKPEGLTFEVKSNYVLATDDDFSGTSNGNFKYIGTDDYVEIPDTIRSVAVTSYHKMFEGSSVKGVKSTNPNITDMMQMFAYSSATTLDLSDFDTSSVTNMEGMFFGCKSKALDLSSFNTSKVINMSGMFSSSEATTILFGNNFDTSNVTNMVSMFFKNKATSLDLSNFDTSNVTDMSNMFNENKATSLVLSSFNTSSVVNMGSMFHRSEATSLNLSNFNTTKVTSMQAMFTGSKVDSLDLSSFNTSNVTNMDNMFDESRVSTGYAKTQDDADKFNASKNKPQSLTFVVKQLR